MINNDQSTDLSRFNDKYLKCIVTKRKSSMNILKDQGAVIIYQNSGYNHLYLGNEFIASGWGFKSKDDLTVAESIVNNYEGDINSLSNNISDIQSDIENLSEKVEDMNGKINPIVYVYDENNEKIPLDEVFFKGIPAFYEDLEITDIEKVIIYNNSQVLKIQGDQNVIDLPLGSIIHKISYNISCNIHDCGGIKELNMSYYESSENSINKTANTQRIVDLQWLNLDANKVLSITHQFIPGFKIDKSDDITVINNMMLCVKGTVKEQYKKYPELTLSNSKFKIYSLENIINDHNIILNPLIIHPVPFIRYYIATDLSNYSPLNVCDTLNSGNVSFTPYKGNIMINDFTIGQFTDIFVPIQDKSTKVIDLFIPKAFDLHEVRYVTSTSEYNWTGATGVLRESTPNGPIVLKVPGAAYIKYNLYQIRISKILENPNSSILETLSETGKLMLRLFARPVYIHNDIYNYDGTDVIFNEPETWKLLYNEEFTRNYWITFKSDMDNLEERIELNYKL